MKNAVGSLFERYRSHHEPDRPILQWIGVVGCIAFPLLYVLRRAAAAGGYEDLWLRVAAVVLCLGLALRRWWPTTLKPYYLAYSWWVVFYCLSFLMSYTMLRNHGGTPFVVNMVMCAVLIVMLADWRNSVAILLLGYVLAVALHLLLDANPVIPRDFVFAGAGSALLVAGGALSHQGQKKVELERMRGVYIGLAGSVAHEMRTPLAQIRHALNNISASVAPPVAGRSATLEAAQAQALLANVQQGQDAIARGLQAIEITLRQLQPNAPVQTHVRTLSAAARVQHAIDCFAYDADEHRSRVSMVVEQDFQLRADPISVELVFFNLLKNALYYVPLRPDMRMVFTVTASPTPRVVVRDSGPGIAEDFMPHLFEEFQTKGKAEGTGLGLSFCRRIMRGLGGDIDCRSEWGRYTEFTLHFPPASASEAAAEEVPAHPPLAGRTVLIVDDQAINRTIARAILGELGVAVEEAEHGLQALDMLQAGPLPDAVLMDINMPGLDGIATTRRLRALPAPAGRVPVVALTANDSPTVQAAAREAGMQGVLGKPIDVPTLQRALSAAMSGAQPAGVAQAPAAVPAAPHPRSEVAEPLNLSRLESFRRLGMLEDVLPRGLLDLRRHLQTIDKSAQLGEQDPMLNALHALVGLAGEVGAQALHGRGREIYVGLREGRGPSGTAWVPELRDLLELTEQAMWRQFGVKAADATPPPTSA